MDKKGEDFSFSIARKQIFFLIIGFVMTIVIIGATMMMVSYKNRLTATPEDLEAELVILRFFNNPECFAYQDQDSGRVYVNTIDLEKFQEQGRIENCYSPEQEKGYQDYNFRLELSGSGVNITTNNYYNKNDFTLFKNVLVVDNGNFKEEVLAVYVQADI